MICFSNSRFYVNFMNEGAEFNSCFTDFFLNFPLYFQTQNSNRLTEVFENLCCVIHFLFINFEYTVDE